jgi:hypothetical protein
MQSSLRGGAAPPLPPFARSPVPSQKVRQIFGLSACGGAVSLELNYLIEFVDCRSVPIREDELYSQYVGFQRNERVQYFDIFV